MNRTFTSLFIYYVNCFKYLNCNNAFLFSYFYYNHITMNKSILISKILDMEKEKRTLDKYTYNKCTSLYIHNWSKHKSFIWNRFTTKKIKCFIHHV